MENFEGSDNWLIGSWYCKEWETSYRFSKNDDEWIMTDEDLGFNKNIIIESEDENQIIFASVKNGTRYIIEKVSNKEMKFQQVAKKGMLGMTNIATFTKKK
ncbi:hypothetical protein BG262_03315 [Floricoccus penangensis]|uniref:Uncharacterized protein n=1 Tax=Floricoccus penangensis TaxID=1859475 RepID=A0A9Q5NZR9_9LACT|nr:hypothetical protein [Floricoccus penangensis]OFI46835.1 hypothetical protein BG262_03315 [Floricoccus penangensis]